MLVSCICVCHDKPDLIPEAVGSLLGQTYPDWEALVVDSGELYDAGYYEPFGWRADPRVRLVRSHETAETRRDKAMAPWCFNECFRRGLVRGELVTYLCDDDIFYPRAFETFVAYCRRNPGARAMYASQDVGVIYPNGWRAVIGERRATGPGGRCRDGRRMDCEVDYLQFCHRADVLALFPDDEYWPEAKETEEHADGLFMERVGAHVPIHPIDVKVSQNRRTARSTYIPLPSLALPDGQANGVPLLPARQDGRAAAEECAALWVALAAQQRRLEELTRENRDLRARQGLLRYRVADRLDALCARLPFVRGGLKRLLRALRPASSRPRAVPAECHGTATGQAGSPR